MIDLDMVPPDWKFASDHAKANRPGLVDDILNPSSNHIFCPCCLKPIIKQDVPICANSKELQFLGFGFPLYFIFIKYCIILILISICSYNVISLYWGVTNSVQICVPNVSVQSQTPQGCVSIFVDWARIQQQVNTEEMIIRITSFSIHLLALLYIRDNITKTMGYYHERKTSLSDFSVIIKNLPLKQGIQKNIRDFINLHFLDQWKSIAQNHSDPEIQSKDKVVQITLLPEIDDYYAVLQHKAEVIEEKKAFLKNHKNDRNDKKGKYLDKSEVMISKIKNANTNLSLISENISQISIRYRQLAKQDRLLSEMAIVTLSSELFKQILLQQGSSSRLNVNSLKQYFGRFDGAIKIKRVPQPSEIIWRNANYPPDKIIFSKIIGWLLSILFIAIITVGFYFLLLLKTKYLLFAIEEKKSISDQSATHYELAVTLVFVDIFLVVLFNKLVMGSVLHYITHKELHFSTADQEFSFALKYTLGLFFTTALMTLAVEAVTFHNFYAHEFGVVEQESIMFIINAFLVPIIWLINPWQISTLIKRKLKQGKKHFTQREANQIMSDTPYVIGKRYAQIIETMWFTYLYATLIPVGVFFTLGGLICYYWVDKLNLLKRSSVNQNVAGDLALVSLKLLDFTLILRPIGELIFDSQIREQIHIESLVLTFFGALYLVLPLNKLLQFFHKEQFYIEQKSYDDVKDMFLETYQTMHPILSFKALKIFDNLKKISSKEIFLNEIELTQQTYLQSPNKTSTLNSSNIQFLNKKSTNRLKQNQLNQNRNPKSVKENIQEKQAQEELKQYQSRQNIRKSASKNYLVHSKKNEYESLIRTSYY